MDEFALIARYFAAAPCARAGGEVVLGIGDDCAQLALASGDELVLSTDSVVAGVHFPDPCDPFLLGQRALAVAASDLAAMGARPLGFTLALTVPSASEVWLEAFACGLNQMAQHCQLRLLGGDTTRGPLNINVTVLGTVPQGRALRRSGAQPGDYLCVGGRLGEAALALPWVLQQRAAQTPEQAHWLKRFWTPQPQLALGQALRGLANAALDISDGLLADAAHLAKASQVRLIIEQNQLPLALGTEREPALSAALSGGDDYLLLFSLPARHWPKLAAQWPECARIGRVEAGSGVYLQDEQGTQQAVSARGFNHFGVSGEAVQPNKP